MAHTQRLTVLRLGRVGWSVAETLQRALVATRQTSALALRGHDESDSIGVGGPAAGHADDVLLLCEHPPVYTTGRRVQVGTLRRTGTPCIAGLSTSNALTLPSFRFVCSYAVS